MWFAHGITTGSNEMIITSTAHQSQPFVIYTEKGFMGIVPADPQETIFIFQDLHIVSGFETGFSNVHADPEPPETQPFLKEFDGYRRI